MPSHPDRVRRYYEWRWWDLEEAMASVPRWRRPSDTEAEQLVRRSIEIQIARAILQREASGITANVIEGDHH